MAWRVPQPSSWSAGQSHHAPACEGQCPGLSGAWALLRAQTYLEQNLGPGLQHLALKTDNIFAALREMRRRSNAGGFDFMPPASDAYYECARAWALLCCLRFAGARQMSRCCSGRALRG